jgi:hypothetical protein
MKNKFSGLCPAGLLLLLLLRQTHTRGPRIRSTVPPNRSLDSSASYLVRKPHIARSRRRRLPIGRWQTNFWTKKSVDVGQAPVSEVVLLSSYCGDDA